MERNYQLMATMRIVALIYDAGVIERIFKHLSVWDPQPETPSPAGIQLSDEAKRSAWPQNHAAPTR